MTKTDTVAQLLLTNLEILHEKIKSIRTATYHSVSLFADLEKQLMNQIADLRDSLERE